MFNQSYMVIFVCENFGEIHFEVKLVHMKRYVGFYINAGENNTMWCFVSKVRVCHSQINFIF